MPCQAKRRDKDRITIYLYFAELLEPENAKEILYSVRIFPEWNHGLNGGGREYSMNCSRIGVCADVHGAVDVMPCNLSNHRCMLMPYPHPICNLSKKKKKRRWEVMWMTDVAA